jgi:hypothetical protein
MLSVEDSRKIVRLFAARFVVRIVAIPGLLMMTTIGNTMERFSTCVAYAQDPTASLAQGIIIEELFTSAMYVIEATAQSVRRWFRAVVGAVFGLSVWIANLIIVPILTVQRFFAMIALLIVMNAIKVGAGRVKKTMP